MAKVPPESNPHIKGIKVINEMLDNICNEINIVIEKVYSSPKCLPLEIQALYTINLLTKELIIEAKQPTPSHVEAIIATIKGWGQIRRFGLEPRSGVAIIERILNIPMPDGKTLREYALEASILDLKNNPIVLKNITADIFNRIKGGSSVWKYKLVHLLLSALYPPFDNKIVEALFGKSKLKSISINIRKYMTSCLKQKNTHGHVDYHKYV
ncbi:MAG TPA: hypothetical protein EYH08_00430, partial [Pyrodictium sp.]|nr:hypothetical protein [Pyrodictium sp.]